eukprot:6882092-Alexandrium_andersonii.AAC.1
MRGGGAPSCSASWRTSPASSLSRSPCRWRATCRSSSCSASGSSPCRPRPPFGGAANVPQLMYQTASG